MLGTGCLDATVSGHACLLVTGLLNASLPLLLHPRSAEAFVSLLAAGGLHAFLRFALPGSLSPFGLLTRSAHTLGVLGGRLAAGLTHALGVAAAGLAAGSTDPQAACLFAGDVHPLGTPEFR